MKSVKLLLPTPQTYFKDVSNNVGNFKVSIALHMIQIGHWTVMINVIRDEINQ